MIQSMPMDTQLDSDLLRTFVAIADSGSFTRAAAAVYRTQSAVSMQVKKLESLVGQPLFAREARGVRLTPSGEGLLAQARRILRLLDQAAESLRPGQVAGAVGIGVPEEYGATILPDVLARFAERHPAVEVTVRCEPSLTLSQALEQSALDLAVVVSDRGPSHGEILIHDPTVWVASARHLVHEQDPLPVAMFDRDCWWRDWALRSLDERGRRYRVAYTSGSVAGIQAAVASGLAVGVLGRSMMPRGARQLSRAEGFDSLPGSSVILRCRPGAASDAVMNMAAAVRDVFQTAAAA